MTKVLPGFQHFVVEFMVQMSKVSVTFGYVYHLPFVVNIIEFFRNLQLPQ